MAKNDPATKQDVEEIVGRVVGEIVGDALQLISERFDKQDKTVGSVKVDIDELKAATIRIENKLDPTIEQVENHEVRLKHLEIHAV